MVVVSARSLSVMSRAHSSFAVDSWFQFPSFVIVVIVELGLVPRLGCSVVIASVVAKHVVVGARLYSIQIMAFSNFPKVTLFHFWHFPNKVTQVQLES